MSHSKERVVVVTGASRGVGKGIALALATPGTTIYVTGRSKEEGDAPLPGTVYATAKDIEERGARGVAVVCDHADDEQVKALFERVREESGHIDILVNNALYVPPELVMPGPFWEKPLTLQAILDVGMRSTYVSSYYAAPLLIKQGGLVVNTSSFGGTCYMHGPAYGAGKAAVDKMAHDMSVDFKPSNVCVVSLWLGITKTERTLSVVEQAPDQYGPMMDMAESMEFTGRVIDALFNDESRMDLSGQVHVGAELAERYGVVDIDGKQPTSNREMLGSPPNYSPAIVE